MDNSIDIHLPYVNMGANAFSGRSLDERVVNPFLHEKSIPCSRGPYLSVFRRNVKFNEMTRQGLKDKEGYDALITLIDKVSQESDSTALLDTLNYVLYRFILLREQANIQLVRLERISLSKYEKLVHGLLNRQSGGVFPLILVVSMLEAISERFSIPWEISYQGINEADRASGAGGDITIRENGVTILTIEVTERPVDVPKVEAIFRDKIAPNNLADYVFMVHVENVEDNSRVRAENYFMHGYDVNFIDIGGWLINSLVIIGVRGRRIFQDKMISHLSDKSIPKALKVAWNEEIERITSI